MLKGCLGAIVLHKWEQMITQNIDVTLCIEISLHNHKICLLTAHDSAPYHDATAPEPVRFPYAALGKSFLSHDNGIKLCVETTSFYFTEANAIIKYSSTKKNLPYFIKKLGHSGAVFN